MEREQWRKEGEKLLKNEDRVIFNLTDSELVTDKFSERREKERTGGKKWNVVGGSVNVHCMS